MILALTTSLKLGRPAKLEYSINKFAYPACRKICQTQENIELLGVPAAAQPIIINEMTFEAYTAHRIISFDAQYISFARSNVLC